MTATLIERLAIKSGVMQMGEPIAWGSDTALMDEAASELARLQRENDALRAALKDAEQALLDCRATDAVMSAVRYARAALEAKP